MDELPSQEVSISISLIFKIGISLIAILSFLIAIFYLQKLIKYLINKFIALQFRDVYEKIIKPEVNWLVLLWFLTVADIVILVIAQSPWLKVGEIFLGLGILWLIIWLGFRWFKRLFDRFLLDIALQQKRKLNSEFFIIGKYSASAILCIVVIFIFAEVHEINLFGLLASLGIGGLAVAFAAQKILEQLLGGIVLYIDRPFVQDDYIGLPDRTFGRVESIGLRSTKIRTSGKGTLMIIPNNSLTQINIENFTGAKKVISLVYLTFDRHLPEEEKALIKQIILESTHDIFGIDPRSTDVIFKDIINGETNYITQAQVNFFLLGSGEVSMELRHQLLNIATENISKKLKEYGIHFDLENKTIDVESPITI